MGGEKAQRKDSFLDSKLLKIKEKSCSRLQKVLENIRTELDRLLLFAVYNNFFSGVS